MTCHDHHHSSAIPCQNTALKSVNSADIVTIMSMGLSFHTKQGDLLTSIASMDWLTRKSQPETIDFPMKNWGFAVFCFLTPIL